MKFSTPFTQRTRDSETLAPMAGQTRRFTVLAALGFTSALLITTVGTTTTAADEAMQKAPPPQDAQAQKLDSKRPESKRSKAKKSRTKKPGANADKASRAAVESPPVVITDPLGSVTDCLDQCRANIERPAFSSSAEPVAALSFENSEVVSAGTFSTKVTVTPNGVEITPKDEAASDSDAKVLRFKRTGRGHLLRFDFNPPLNGDEIAAVSILTSGIETAHTSRFRFAAPGEQLEPAREAAFHFNARAEQQDALITTGNLKGWKGPISSIGLHIGQGAEQWDSGEAFDTELIEIAFWPKLTPIAQQRLIQHATTSVFSSDHDADAEPRSIKRGNDTRHALYAPTPSSCSCDVDLPAGAVLAMDFVAPKMGTPATKVTFSASLTPKDGEEQLLWSAELGPETTAEKSDWKDQTVPLSGIQSGPGTITFRTCGGPCDQPDKDAGLAAVWGNLSVYPVSRRKQTPPPASVVMVSLGAVRADRIGAYGSDGVPTPNLDRLAEAGVLFENAYAQGADTFTSHSALLTGLYPSESGAEPGVPLSVDATSLIERLRDAGYRTGAVTDGEGVGSAFGLDRGFQIFIEGDHRGNRGIAALQNTELAAEEWLVDHSDRPFFLFVHTARADTPFDSYPETVAKLTGAERPEWMRIPLSRSTIRASLTGAWAKQRLPQISALYDAGLHELDQAVGRLFNNLSHLGLSERTIFVVVADHGQDLMDHLATGLDGHSLYQEIVHVPLIIAGPGLEEFAGKRVRQPVELKDVLPSTMALAGVELSTEGTSAKSFADLVTGDAASDPRPVYSELDKATGAVSVITEHNGTTFKLIHTKPATAAELAARLKPYSELPGYVGTDEEWLLFNLNADPKETKNLAASDSEALAHLKRLVEKHRAERAGL